MNKEKIWQTYIITNKINGKVYIGKTNDIIKRYRNHINSSFNKKAIGYDFYLHRAIRKYNRNNFIIETIEYYSSEVEAFGGEIFWIAEIIKFLGKNNVYNTTGGGEGSSGYKFSEEAKQKMSIAKSGENNYNYGKHLSEETKQKISITKGGENNPSCKLTQEIVNKIRFEYKTNEFTRSELSKKYNTSVRNVGDIVNNKSWIIK